MSYIGTTPPQTFSTATSQSFSGNGSTTVFTLNRAVNRNEDLEVFVENVQQKPATSYTASGTTLTFQAAPVSGSNNIYVIDSGKVVDSGKHVDLMDKSELYRSFYEKQVRKE